MRNFYDLYGEIGFFLLVALLSGCTKQEDTMGQALRLRSQVQSGNCAFDAQITADYGDKLYTFMLHCQMDVSGDLTFVVIEPTGIAGISGKIDASGGKLTFDNVVLAFDMMADGQLTPISAPWVFATALRGGYITATGNDGKYTILTIRDSYAEDALTVDISLDAQQIPVCAQITWQDRRILSMVISNFTLS